MGPVVTLDRVTAGERFWAGGLAGELEEQQGRKHGQSGLDRAGHRVGVPCCCEDQGCSWVRGYPQRPLSLRTGWDSGFMETNPAEV